jgi:hypothetical protein
MLSDALGSAEGDGQMKASALFGAGWENDPPEVLWQDEAWTTTRSATR